MTNVISNYCLALGKKKDNAPKATDLHKGDNTHSTCTIKPQIPVLKNQAEKKIKRKIHASQFFVHKKEKKIRRRLPSTDSD